MSKTISLPPVPTLEASLAFVALNRVDEGVRRLQLSSTDKIKRYANAARSLSEKVCFFCGKEDRPKVKLKSNEWTGYPLCGCIVAKYSKGYQENIAWQDVRAVEDRMSAGHLSPDAVAFSDDCSKCGERFSITVGQIVKAAHRHGQYRQATRCKQCAEHLRQAGTTNLITRAERPHQKTVLPHASEIAAMTRHIPAQMAQA